MTSKKNRLSTGPYCLLRLQEKVVPKEQHVLRHQCRKAAILSCHRCVVYTGVEKMNYI